MEWEALPRPWPRPECAAHPEEDDVAGCLVCATAWCPLDFDMTRGYPGEGPVTPVRHPNRREPRSTPRRVWGSGRSGPAQTAADTQDEADGVPALPGFGATSSATGPFSGLTEALRACEHPVSAQQRPDDKDESDGLPDLPSFGADSSTSGHATGAAVPSQCRPEAIGPLASQDSVFSFSCASQSGLTQSMEELHARDTPGAAAAPGFVSAGQLITGADWQHGTTSDSAAERAAAAAPAERDPAAAPEPLEAQEPQQSRRRLARGAASACSAGCTATCAKR